MTKAVSKKKEGSLAVPSYGDMKGGGFEDTTSADLAIPFINVLQANSPQVSEEEPEGSKPGLLFNTVTHELHESVVFVPCVVQHAYVEWVPRNDGGGFVGVHQFDSEIAKEGLKNNGGSRIGNLPLDNGNELVETYYVFGLTLDDKGETPEGFAVIAFTSTKIKPWRSWLTAMRMIKDQPPMFANRARLSTVKQKNEHGTFFNIKIQPLHESWITSLIDPEKEKTLLEEAVSLREMISSGVATAAFETQDATSGTGEADDKPPF